MLLGAKLCCKPVAELYSLPSSWASLCRQTCHAGLNTWCCREACSCTSPLPLSYHLPAYPFPLPSCFSRHGISCASGDSFHRRLEVACQEGMKKRDCWHDLPTPHHPPSLPLAPCLPLLQKEPHCKRTGRCCVGAARRGVRTPGCVLPSPVLHLRLVLLSWVYACACRLPFLEFQRRILLTAYCCIPTYPARRARRVDGVYSSAGSDLVCAWIRAPRRLYWARLLYQPENFRLFSLVCCKSTAAFGTLLFVPWRGGVCGLWWHGCGMRDAGTAAGVVVENVRSALLPAARALCQVATTRSRYLRVPLSSALPG